MNKIKNAFEIKDKDKVIYFFLIIYTAINLFYLDSFPFVHSDEAWLASLTRSIIKNRSLSAVEDFFILVKRFPHALKSLFHLIQLPFVSVSFSVNSVRIISIIFSLVNLWYFYRLLKGNIKSRYYIITAVLLLSTDIQYLYISRFARQEIIILTVMTVSINMLYKDASIKKTVILSLLTGLSAGIHPNSFMIFTATVLMMAANLIILKEKRKQLFCIILYTTVTGIIAAVFVFISLKMDSDFISHYLDFGSRHGVSDIFIVKILKLKRFYFKMFNRVSGTYFLPDIRFQLIVFLSTAVLSAVLSVFSGKIFRKVFPVLMFLTGINISYILIGKYSPPSISFIFPVFWFLTVLLADSISVGKRLLKLLIMLILVLNILNTSYETVKWKNSSYDKYMNRIDSIIGDDSKTFGCISTAFFMDYGQLAAYNDLSEIKSFRDYITENRIRYIIYTEELDIIFSERPLWNDLYGNIYPHYDEIKSFLKNECVLKDVFYDDIYPVRIVDYMKKREYSVKIYEVE